MKIIAKSLVKHNGTYYQFGDEIHGLNEKETASLLASNVIEVRDGKVEKLQPEDVRNAPSDVVLKNKGLEESASMSINASMKKTILIGVARANGLTVEQTATPEEVYKMIKEYREKNGIVIEDAEVTTKVTAPNPQAPKKDKKDDKPKSTPSGVDKETDKK